MDLPQPRVGGAADEAPHLLAGRFGDDELREVWAVLDRLKYHELVREIESAEEVRA